MRLAYVNRFLRDTRSTTAVEFAMIGAVLFLFLMGILIMGVAQFWQLTLDDAVRNATRQVQIGSPTKVVDGAGFVTAVCKEFGLAVSNCGPATIQYSVQGAATFSNIVPATVNAAGTLSGSGTFIGVANSNPMLVQVAYIMPFTIPLVPLSMTTFNGTPALISAVAVLQEP